MTDRPPAPPSRSCRVILSSIFHWAASALFFFTVCPVLILLGMFIDPRKNDAPQRWMCRWVARLAGAQVELRVSPHFDPARAGFLVSNHVNLFDPFVLYGVIPVFFRGLELESHFRVPVYGWLMKRFGNVPVPDSPRPADLKRMWRLAQDALARGIHLLVFPEGSRTLTGRVGKFQDGAFRMALQFGAPLTPVSIVGSFEFNRKTSWLLRPSRVVVHLHPTIDTTGLDKKDFAALRDRVHAVISAPVDAFYRRASSS